MKAKKKRRGAILKGCNWCGKMERVAGTALCQKCVDRKKSGKGKPNYDAMNRRLPGSFGSGLRH